MKFKLNKKIILAVLVFLAVAGASTGGYYLGYQTGLDETRNITIEGLTGAETPEGIGADFGIFWEAWDTIKKAYIRGGELDDQKLIYGAIRGLTEALDDPNTVFLSPEDSEKFSEDIQGSFGGIGAEIDVRDGQLIVVAPLKNTPAERAGLKSGDQILEIDGRPTEELTVDEAVKLIRGELGTTVTLTIGREEWNEPNEISIVRENIQIPTVEWEMKEGNIIYLKLYSFTANAPQAFYQAVLQGLQARGKGMVLDLRNNPGGYLDVSVNLAGWFLDRGDVVVIERFSSGEEKVFRARGNEALANFPVVVLVNEGSASASEILAGSLRINRDTELVGEKSFGKGTVQELEELSDGSTLKVTIANWLLADGTLIEGNGLEPDYPIPLTGEDTQSGRDPQLERAIELVKQEIK
ncbi:MAG TPA: S41 family peptidase [Candidatus Paceibacterota bacterium]